MKFTKSPKEPKKSPEEEYAAQISTLTENELRDMHKDLKIDHYGNSTAAVINTASGVGLLSMRSTTRRYRTERMQIEAMEARMAEMGWTPHPNRYRDAVPIALGVAAGTTSGMTFGLVNVEKSAKRTKEYVKKKDLFKTKEMVEVKEIEIETEDAVFIEKVEVSESCLESLQTFEAITEHVTVEHRIARKRVPAPAATNTEAEILQQGGLGVLSRVHIITKETSEVPAEPIVTETAAPSTDEGLVIGPNATKREALFSQISVMNNKMRSFKFKKDKDDKETTVSVIEIANDVQSPVVEPDGADSHGIVENLETPPTYTSEAKECIAGGA